MFLHGRNAACVWCSFLEECCLCMMFLSWKECCLCVMFLPGRIAACVWCSFLEGLLLVYDIPSWKECCLCMIFLPGRIAACVWYSFLEGLLLVYDVPSWKDSYFVWCSLHTFLVLMGRYMMQMQKIVQSYSWRYDQSQMMCNILYLSEVVFVLVNILSYMGFRVVHNYQC